MTLNHQTMNYLYICILAHVEYKVPEVLICICILFKLIATFQRETKLNVDTQIFKFKLKHIIKKILFIIMYLMALSIACLNYLQCFLSE